MVAALPAIDANDERKSLAAFRFYCCLLSSLGGLPVRARCARCACGGGGVGGAWSPRSAFGAVAALQRARAWLRRARVSPAPLPHPPTHPARTPQEGPTPALPLYTEEWAEELLARCFAVVAALGALRAGGGGSVCEAL